MSPQDVEEQESRLTKNTRLLEELQGTVRRLQAELAVSQHHLQQQQGERQEAQSHVEALQRAEQQTRVALECMHARVKGVSTLHCRLSLPAGGTLIRQGPPQAQAPQQAPEAAPWSCCPLATE